MACTTESGATRRRVVVVGGGISGLAAARRLLMRGGVDVTLIEADSRLGGKILTERTEDGFVIEAGPDSFLSTKPRGIGLCRELGLKNRLQGPNPAKRGSYVMRDGRLYRIPEGLSGLIPARLGPLFRSQLISPWGKARLGLDFLLPPHRQNGDESLASFVRRRLGTEVYRQLVEPLMAGIYAGDGEQLSVAATFPQLRRLEQEHGGLIKGVRASRAASTPTKSALPAFLAPLTGMGELVETLGATLAGATILSPVRALSVESGEAGYSVRLEGGNDVPAESVIVATPAHAAADLLAAGDADLAAQLRAIPYVSTVTVSVAYPARKVPRTLDAYGYIVPKCEGKPVLACTWTSSKFAHRAPEGHALIRVFLGRAGREDALTLSDEEILALVHTEVHDVLGITANPELYRVYRWPRAMPQYTLGHLDRLRTIDTRLTLLPGIFLAGSAYRGVGIPDCIDSGEAAADRAVAHLTEAPL